MAFVIVVSFVIILWRSPALETLLNDPDEFCMLALGQLTLLGQIPGRDLITIAGPTAALLYSGALYLVDSPLAAILLGACGFALFIGALWALTRAHGATHAQSAVLLLVAHLLLPYLRLFRWVQWALPVLLLVLVHAYDRRCRMSYVCAAAGASFLAVLWRVDVGGAMALAGLAGLVAADRKAGRQWLYAAGRFLAVFAVLFAGWLAWLLAVGGDVSLYLRLTLVGALAHAGSQTWLLDLRYGVLPLGFAAGLACVYVFALRLSVGLGSVAALPQPSRRHPALMAGTIAGLAMLPSAVYQPNINHIVFVLGPFLAVCGMLLGMLNRSTQPFRGAWQAGLACGGLCLVVVAWPVSGGVASSSLNPVPRLLTMHNARQEIDGRPVATLAAQVERATSENDTVVFGSDYLSCPLVYFSRRRSAGLDFVLSTTLQPTAVQQAANLRVIADRQPAAIAAPNHWLSDRGSMLYRYPLDQYRAVVFDDGETSLLKRELVQK